MKQLAILCLAIITLFAPLCAAAKPLKQEELRIQTAKTELAFTVRVAVTPQEQMRGLQGEKALGDYHGMLFLAPEPKQMVMWMKATLIPLDMLFIDSQGKIVHIHERAAPNSTEPITTHLPVRAVLELRGGVTREMNIRIGDRAVHPAFGHAGRNTP